MIRFEREYQPEALREGIRALGKDGNLSEDQYWMHLGIGAAKAWSVYEDGENVGFFLAEETPPVFFVLGLWANGQGKAWMARRVEINEKLSELARDRVGLNNEAMIRFSTPRNGWQKLAPALGFHESSATVTWERSC